VGSLPNHILIAVSSTNIVTPSTVWTFFSFQQDQVSPTGDTGKFADYPTLGIDANALYMGVNIFGTRGLGSFSSTTAFVIRKSSILGPGPIVVTATGFFDPGLGFSNRISASILGTGVTVNSINYTDPTHLTSNLSVASNATAGLRSIQVTNPDGQSALSTNAILTVLGTSTNIPPPPLIQAIALSNNAVHITWSCDRPEVPTPIQFHSDRHKFESRLPVLHYCHRSDHNRDGFTDLLWPTILSSSVAALIIPHSPTGPPRWRVVEYGLS
jgi:hypothetical protein